MIFPFISFDTFDNPNFIAILLVLFLLFLLFREIVTWYFKINKIVKLLEKIEQNTRQITYQGVKIGNSITDKPIDSNIK